MGSLYSTTNPAAINTLNSLHFSSRNGIKSWAQSRQPFLSVFPLANAELSYKFILPPAMHRCTHAPHHHQNMLLSHILFFVNLEGEKCLVFNSNRTKRIFEVDNPLLASYITAGPFHPQPFNIRRVSVSIFCAPAMHQALSLKLFDRKYILIGKQS